MLNNNFL